LDGYTSLTVGLQDFLENGEVDVYAFNDQGLLMSRLDSVKALSGASSTPEVKANLSASAESWSRTYVTDLTQLLRSPVIELIKRRVMDDARSSGQTVKYRLARTHAEARANVETAIEMVNGLLTLTIDQEPSKWDQTRSNYSQLLGRLLSVDSVFRDMVSSFLITKGYQNV
jgi:hypothetical protein